MDQTYAKVKILTTPRKFNQMQQNQQLRRSRHLREQFNSRLPIEYRYPKKRNSVTSSTTRHRSLWSKSSSSGYSSSGSVSSITTVVSGVKPYRPKLEQEPVRERRVSASDEKNEVIRVRSKEGMREENEKLVEADRKSQSCCIECREKEIRQELDLESHQYANISSINKPDDPYVFLMTSMLSTLQKDDGGRKVAKVQQRIEKVLRMKPREPFNVEDKLIFDRQVSSFASDVSIRLQAVSEVAPEAYREISARFCEALHQGTPNSTSLKSIMRGVKNLLTF